MARIRSIHPGLFTDEAFVSLSPAAQILWIGMWCEADDQGVFEWKPTTLKMRILPAATEAIEPLLEELEDANSIRAYAVEGRRYGVIRNFVRHQRPKSPKEVHPLPVEHRAYAGYTSDGARPNATTGRKRYGVAPDTRDNRAVPPPEPFEDFSDFSAFEPADHIELEGVQAPVRNEFGTGSEAVPEFGLRWRMEDEGWKEPSREVTDPDEARVTPAHARTHVGAQARGDHPHHRGSETPVSRHRSAQRWSISAAEPRRRPNTVADGRVSEKLSIAALEQPKRFAGHFVGYVPRHFAEAAR